MDDAPLPQDSSLKVLKAMVFALLAVMIVGFIVLIALFVTRLTGATEIVLPESITLPSGVVPEAFTATADWYAIVTEDGQILVFDRAGGALIKTIEISEKN